jgi:hypothetical protein
MFQVLQAAQVHKVLQEQVLLAQQAPLVLLALLGLKEVKVIQAELVLLAQQVM